MLRHLQLLVLAAWIFLGIPCGTTRADDEADLLKKFKSQNKAAADKLKEEASRLLNPSSAPGHAAKTQPGAAALNTSRPALGPASGSDSKIQVGPAVILITARGPIRVPDGGTSVLSSYANLAEARNEGGVPIIGGVPYLGRGFRNVSYGRSFSGTQLSASVRIIRMAEEEARFLGNK